jgi:hypothetical protein
LPHREPFADIVEKTLARLLLQRFGVAHRVSWRTSSFISRLRSTNMESPSSMLQSPPVAHADLYRLTTDAKQWLAALVIYLLEDLHWHVKENSNPLFHCRSGGWLTLRKEMPAALQHVVSASEHL